jgi:hypothetical protein
LHQLALTSQKMADSKHNSDPQAQTPKPRQVSTDGTPGAVEEGEINVHIDTSDRPLSQDDDCPLWDGHIIDAIFPTV